MFAKNFKLTKKQHKIVSQPDFSANPIPLNIHKQSSSMEKLVTTPPTNKFFARVSDEWVSCVHKNYNFDDAFGYLMAMLQQQDQIQSEQADLFFREICDKNVFFGQRVEQRKK